VASANNSRVELFGVDNFLQLSAPPAGGVAAAGQNLIFSVTAGGINALNFQWQKNGVNLAGATNATLTISNAATGDSGNYSVVITSASGSTTNIASLVNVFAAPGILVNPQGQTVMLGATASFSVTASGTALNYQWQFNGVNLAGATNSTLFLPGVQAAQAGQYAVQVGNPLGSVVSAAANLTVISPPSVVDIVAVAQTNQLFQLTMNVDPGFVYALDATTNLLDWQTIASFTDAAGLFDFVDMESTNYASRFYRLRWAQ
jgi:hypothetical protein